MLSGCSSSASIVELKQGGLPPDDLFGTRVEITGEPIRFGRLETKFLVFDSGHEAILLARSDKGFTLIVERREEGGSSDSISEYVLDGSMRALSMTFRTFGRESQELTFEMRPGEIIRRNGSEERRVPIENDAVFVGPHDTAMFLVIRPNSDLAVGESRTFPFLHYGNTGEHLARSDATIARLEDDTVETALGEMDARVFSIDYPTENPKIRSIYWVDEDGFVLRGRTRLPVGGLSMRWTGTTKQ